MRNLAILGLIALALASCSYPRSRSGQAKLGKMNDTTTFVSIQDTFGDFSDTGVILEYIKISEDSTNVLNVIYTDNILDVLLSEGFVIPITNTENIMIAFKGIKGLYKGRVYVYDDFASAFIYQASLRNK